MKNKLAIFDLDGTLFNTNDVNYYSYKQALEEYGYTLEYEYYCKKCNGRHYKVFLPIITSLEENDVLLEKIHDKKKALYSSNLKFAVENRSLFDIVKSIKNETYLAVVTTASRKNCEEILNYFQKQDLFDLIITHEDVIKMKPDPEGFLKAIEYFKIDPKDTMIFEDSDVGINSALQTNAAVYRILCF